MIKNITSTMKRILSLVLTLAFPMLAVMAQPAWTKKATKSVFTLKTFADDGALLGSSNGFFTSEQGSAVSNYTPFKGASRAVVIDAAGKEYNVDYIIGANETYDIIKFHVDVKKATPLTFAQGIENEGNKVWLLPYRELKEMKQGTIRKAEKVNTYYGYYTIAMTANEKHVSCPILNEAGNVIGIMQASTQKQDTLNYAVSALMADSLKISGLNTNDPILQAIHIKKALPESRDEAVLALLLGSASPDKQTFAVMVDDFIAKFPEAVDGYVYRAGIAYQQDDFAAAERDYQTALSKADRKDEAHYNYSRLIFEKEIYKSNVPYAAWTLNKALEEVRKAHQINPQPAYRYHEANVLYALKDYEGASAVYKELFTTNLRSAELFYEASRCAEMLKDTVAQIALLDSAVATFSKPYLKAAAPYLLERARVNHDASNYRAAILDYNEYELLMKGQLKARFYYLRFQAELDFRQYQIALNDINTAISMEPEYDLYHAEKASLLLRVGYFDDALEEANECIRLAPEHSDGYLFLGVAQCQLGKTAEGLVNLKKAAELGDTQATQLIEKYSKTDKNN